MFHRITGQLPWDTDHLQALRQLYFQLSAQFDHSVLLDSCGWQGVTGGFYMMGFGADWVIHLRQGVLHVNGQAVAVIDTKEQLWEQLESWFQQSRPLNPDVLDQAERFPFTDGWVGVVGYELNHLLEPRVAGWEETTPLGELYFVRCPHRILWRPGQNKLAIASDNPQWVASVHHFIESGTFQPIGDISWGTLPPPKPSFVQDAFESGVERILEHIRAGDIYQANLSIRFEREQFPAQALPTLYQSLAQRNPSPFSGVLKTPQGVVIANSPERLVKYDARTNIVETRPIAGTRGRGRNPKEEARIDRILKTDEKEQAEHLMLVDLERNDIGRVAQPASVSVTESFVLEKYSHVTHLVSQIEGRKDPGKSRWEILEALFPGGTITGCPKVRCMEILSQLEPVPRGLYTGSLGYLDFNGNLDFNILIRSLFYWPDETIHYHVGAGIVADSVPVNEYRECFRKAQAIQGVLG